MRRISIGLLAGGLAASTSMGQCTAITELELGATPTGSFRGTSVDIEQRDDETTLAAIGMPLTTGSGSVRIMRRTGVFWMASQTLTPTYGSTVESFGKSVQFLKNYTGPARLIVGAPNEGRGLAFVFQETSPGVFTQTHVINSPNATDNSFGAAVSTAILGNAMDIAVVGAPDADQTGLPGAGRAYMFELLPGGVTALIDTWRGIKFNANSDLTEARVGQSVDADLNTVMVGGPNSRNFNGTPQGHASALKYDSNTDLFDMKSSQFTNQADAGLGSAVAVSGTHLVIGAPQYDSSANQTPGGPHVDCGGVLFLRIQFDNTVTSQGYVFAPDAEDGAFFGASVDIQGPYAVIGAPGVKKAYLYRYTGTSWELSATLTDQGASGSQAFGAAVAIVDDEVLVADPQRILSPTLRGSVYAFKISQEAGRDTCEDAMEYLVDTDVSRGGCNTFAITNGSASCGLSERDVWYTFVAPCSGNTLVTTLGSDFDTVLSVHSGCPGDPNAQEIACNDDATPGVSTWSRLTIATTAGTRYWVRIAGYGAGPIASQGNYVIVIKSVNPTPANDSCADAQVISPGIYQTSTCTATTDGPNSISDCTGVFNVSKDLWYRYVPPQDQGLQIVTCGSTFDTVLQVWAGSPCGTSDVLTIACNDDSAVCGGTSLDSAVQFTASAGVEYLIRVGGLAEERGDVVFRLIATNICHCDFNHSGALEVQDIFDFLNAWFAGDAAADFNGTSVISVQDIFDFLNCWFGGCD